MPTIRVFPSALDDEPAEIHTAKDGQTLHDWLADNVPAYEVRENPLFFIRINGQLSDCTDYSEITLNTDDCIDLIISPKDPVTAILVVVAVAAAGYAIYTANQIPDNYNNTTPDGSSIYSANLQGNRARLMGIIPEIAGEHKQFPDLLGQPRRRYEENDQYIYLMMCVGAGEYEINPDQIYIGETPISNYSNDINYTIYQPGETLTNSELVKNFYTSDEVGTTSGASGIELEGSFVGGGSPESQTRWDFGDVGIDSPIYNDRSPKSLVMRRLREDDYGDTFYMNVEFPFSLNSTLTITNAGANNGTYKIITTADISNSFTDYIGILEKLDENGNQVADWPGFEPVSLSDALVDSTGGQGSPDDFGLYSGPFFACPENETTDLIELDFFMPRGLGKLEDNGLFSSITVEVEIQYREAGGEWQTITKTYIDNTNDQLGKTEFIQLPEKIRPEVRVRRLTKIIDNTRVSDTVEWQALKCELQTPASYDGVTTIAVRMKGTNALSRRAQNKFNIVCTRKLPVYENGAWSEPVPTHDIAPFFAHVIKSVGHSDDQMYLPDLQILHELWSGREDTFSAIFDNESTLFDVLKRVLAPGYAEPTLDRGQIIPVRDQLRDSYDYMYQPDNMVSPLVREKRFFDADEHDGIEVEYMSKDTWKPQTIKCLLPEDAGINLKKIRAFGITDPNKAWRLGMRKRRELRYRRTRYSFTTEMDALNSSYLSYDAIGDDIPGYSQTGRILNAQGRVLTLNQSVEFGEGTHYISLRKPDGSLSGPYICTKGADDFEVITQTDIDFTPVFDGSMEPTLYQFGEAERWTLPVLITDISPSGTDKVSVKAVNYDPRVYADDDN